MRLIGKRGSLAFIITTVLLISLFSSCSQQQRIKVVNFPENRPFVYSNQINILDTLPKDEKKRLITELQNYWEDSLQVRIVQKYIGLKNILSNPPVFDSSNIPRSMTFMTAYLNSQGYFYSGLKDSVSYDTFKTQLRANVFMNITVGKNISIDSVSYDFSDSTLRALVLANTSESLLKKGKAYTKQVISDELDRLTNLFRQNGYYNFNRDDLMAVVDTLDTKLLPLTLDPFKQAEIIAQADKRRKENPTWDINLTHRPIFDSSKLLQFSMGHIYYYPETGIADIPDSVIRRKDFKTDSFRAGIMKYNKGLFRFRPLREHTYLSRGDKYNEANYYKTINRLGQLGAWQQADAVLRIRDKDTLDMHILLVPAIKQTVAAELEGSRNSGDVITGNTLGISTNLSYTNRNRWRQAVQQQTVLRTGVELNLLSQGNNPLLQTFLLSGSHTYVLPRILTPFGNWRSLRNLENKKTLFTLNSSYIDRKNFYNVTSFTASIGYEWRKPVKNGDHLWLYKPLNIELYGIKRLAGLDSLIKNNPFLQASFNEGNIVSQSLSFIRTTTSPKNRNKSHYLRIGIEEAGGLFGLLPGLQNNIYRYIKTETEYRQRILYPKSELAYRAFAGFGYNYGSDPTIGRTLPFFKQFIVGGPYSMRAWGLRQLGLGSSVFSDTVNSSYRDRFGDMQLETNIEYRFQLASLGSFKIGSAVFADIGNIWNLKKNAQDPDSRFSFGNLGKDLAIGIGTGLRFDFSYFLIRFDVAYRVKDPARSTNGGWMSIKDFVWSEQRTPTLKVNNAALQFGIGLPF
ncbi:BamA/TamA family outer membrane protein [Sediminibacterium sp.]|uniref:BamA/TamA family outer membrane protein n=1 Tax=Sediminibacterium sp. TaxID=1917865 RepID=UPI0025FC1DAF|nr:BamA/TamA family outer membrane protein [Sediminibacterium sp.]MBW0177842.1 BamA/TamA family outer membrane protein [Sediminibacterium sp.]